MARVAPAWFLLVVLAFSLPVSAGPDPAFRGVSYSAVWQPGDAALQENVNPQVEGDTGTFSCSQGQYIFRNLGGSAFRFLEGSDEQACAEVYLDITPPTGANRVVVSFVADRDVEVQATTNLAVDFQQRFRVYDGNGALQSQRTVFDDRSVKEQLTPIDIVLENPTETQRVSWFFHDRGTTGLPGVALPGGAAAEANVADIQVHFDQISLPFVDDRRYLESTRDAATYTTTATTRVDTGMLGIGQTELHFSVSNSHSLRTVYGPDGELGPDDFRTFEEGGILNVLVPAPTPGRYEAVFLSSVAHTTSPWLVPIIAALAVAPLVAGAFATDGLRRFGQEAVGGVRASAGTLRFALVFLWALYAGILAVVGFAGLLRLATSWPLRLEAVFLHAGWVLLTVSFLGIGMYWRRALAKAMQIDLAEKAAINERLARSNQELEQFAYVASHDLQEPLRTVTNFTQLLQRRYGDQLDDEADEFMQYIVEGTGRMKTLIGDLLTYSRVGTDGRPHQMVPLDEVLQLVTRALGAALQESGGKVTWKDLPTVSGDLSQLVQLFQNLIGNSLKFRHPRRAPRVRIDCTTDERGHVLSVSDNGIGFDQKFYDRIFVVFQRLQRSEDAPGTGIGLAICKKIVERHNGEIWVESVPDKGSTFFIRLPSVSPVAN